MQKLWLLKGGHDAGGWRLLEKEAKAKEIDIIHFDRDAWAIMRAQERPTKYDGMVVTEPPDGMYLDQHGRPVYIVNGDIATGGPREVITALGAQAEDLMQRLNDADLVLERLGRAF